MTHSKIKVIFTDLGGVLLTNGWDHLSRKKAVSVFKLDEKEFESRHQLLFGEYEIGKISLETYLDYVIFYKPQPFTHQLFIEFMLAQSQPFPDMLSLMQKIKKERNVKIVVISNEGFELTQHRIQAFNLRKFVDFFLVSCFLGIRKPDFSMWIKALDFVQVKADEAIYLDDRELFIEIARKLGMHSFCHKNYETTNKFLNDLF